VVAVLHGRVWSGVHVRKAHSGQLDAFDGGGHMPLALLDACGQWVDAAPAWPASGQMGWEVLRLSPPRVELIYSHADADGWLVDAARRHANAMGPLDGLILAGTGHGTLHQGLQEAVRRAAAQGVRVWRSSRVARGGVISREGDEWPAAGDLTPPQARVALMLALLSERAS